MMTVTRGGKSHRVYKTTYLFERKSSQVPASSYRRRA